MLDVSKDAAAGTRFVKVGFAGISSEARIAALASAAQRGVVAASAGRCGIVLVAYADADPSASPTAGALVDIAARAGARGVLLDTADKNGCGLRALIDRDTLRAFVARAHANGLSVALAGRLTADDLPFVQEVGADIAGVRGAACDGGGAWLAGVGGLQRWNRGWEGSRQCSAAWAPWIKRVQGSGNGIPISTSSWRGCRAAACGASAR